MKKTTFIIVILCLIFQSCVTNDSSSNPSTSKVTITTENYPAYFDTLFAVGVNTGLDFEIRRDRYIEQGRFNKEEGTRINYEYFLENVAKKPGFVTVGTYTDRIDGLKKVETCHLEFSLIGRGLNIKKSIYNNGNKIYTISFITGTSSVHALNMLLYIDGREITLTDSNPTISTGDKYSAITLIFALNFEPYINSILACNNFGFNNSNQKIMLTDKELANVKRFLTIDK